MIIIYRNDFIIKNHFLSEVSKDFHNLRYFFNFFVFTIPTKPTQQKKFTKLVQIICVLF